MMKSSNDKSKSPMKMEEDCPTKPKPPTAAVPPEVRSERPLLDDKHITEGKGDLTKPVAPVFMEGFDKQKGKSSNSSTCPHLLIQNWYSVAYLFLE